MSDIGWTGLNLYFEFSTRPLKFIAFVVILVECLEVEQLACDVVCCQERFPFHEILAVLFYESSKALVDGLFFLFLL